MTAPVPGWYPDPDVPGLQRWWDGAAWTGWTRSTDGVAAAQPGPAPRRRRRRAGTVAAVIVGAVAAVSLVGSTVAFLAPSFVGGFQEGLRDGTDGSTRPEGAPAHRPTPTGTPTGTDDDADDVEPLLLGAHEATGRAGTPTSMRCAELVREAVVQGRSDPDASWRLASVRDVRSVVDDQRDFRLPTDDEHATLVLRCRANVTWGDGTRGDATFDLVVDRHDETDFWWGDAQDAPPVGT